MKQKVKEITRKTLPISFEERITKLKAFTRGYFSFSEQFQKSRRTVPNVTQLKISFVWFSADRSGEPPLGGVRGALAVI